MTYSGDDGGDRDTAPSAAFVNGIIPLVNVIKMKKPPPKLGGGFAFLGLSPQCVYPPTGENSNPPATSQRIHSRISPM